MKPKAKVTAGNATTADRRLVVVEAVGGKLERARFMVLRGARGTEAGLRRDDHLVL